MADARAWQPFYSHVFRCVRVRVCVLEAFAIPLRVRAKFWPTFGLR